MAAFNQITTDSLNSMTARPCLQLMKAKSFGPRARQAGVRHALPPHVSWTRSTAAPNPSEQQQTSLHAVLSHESPFLQLRYPSANPLTPLTALCLQHLQTPLSLHQLSTLTFSPLSPPLLRSLSRKSTHTLALPLSSSTFAETVMTSMPTGTRSRRLVCSSEVKSAVRFVLRTECEGSLRSKAREMAMERVSRSRVVVEAGCEERWVGVRCEGVGRRISREEAILAFWFEEWLIDRVVDAVNGSEVLLRVKSR